MDGEAQFKQAMVGVNTSLRAVRSEIALSEAQFKGQANTLDALTAKDKLLRQEIEQQTEKVRALEQAMRDAVQVYGENSAQADKYRSQLSRAKAELIGMNRALEDNGRYMEEARNSTRKTANSIDEFGFSTKKSGDAISTMAAALRAAGVAYSLKEIADAIHACVDASMEFETALANVNKVAKLSDGELANMGEAIKELSAEMPATTGEIAQVVEASARLGISKENLLEFSKVMLDLGNVSDLSADQAATALARFANITGTAAEDYGRLGSTIVALGNNFATSESEITEMASRLASAGTLAGLTEAQVMGLSAAMTSVGINAEAGGTAMTQTLTALEKTVTSGGDKLESFAQVAGMSSQQFADAWENEPVTAVQAFISGLGQLDNQGESATQILEELGLSGIRQSNMLKSLALASETLTGTLTMADQAWRENSELAETAAAKYDTTEAKMQMAANAANNLKIAVGDALAPALGATAEAGTTAFSWVAEIVERHPAFVTAITAMVGVIGLAAGGLTAYTVVANLAAVASGALATAMNLIPGVAVVTAITGIVAALGTFSSKTDEARTENEKFLESLEETKSRLAENTKAAQGNAEDLRAQADALIYLAGAGELNAAQQQALLGMIQELNGAVPGLNLAYDEQTGKLNMTADAVRDLIEAEARRMVANEGAAAYSQVLVQQAETARQINAAEAELAQVRAESEAAMQREIETGQVDIGLKQELEQRERKLIQAIEEGKEVYREQQAALDDITATYGDVSFGAESAVGSTNDLSDSIQSVGDSADDAVPTIADLEKASLSLSKAGDTLTKALKEQEEAGSLSYKTAQDLIDAGYGAALAIDQESGAVTLNRERYIELTNARISDQIAALETQRTAILTSDKLYQEAAAAERAGSAYWTAAKDKAVFSHADDLTAINAQIAAMNRLRSTLGSVSAASSTAARRSSSASKKAKTQAEKDLEEYKQLKAELDHQKNMELVDEEEYYRRLGEYRDRYLTDDSNVSEYRKVTEAIYKHDKTLAERESKLLQEQEEQRRAAAERQVQLWEEQTDKLVDELEDRVKAVSDRQNRMQNSLEDYGELFTVKDDRMKLESLQKQIDAIDSYEKALTGLQERGISDGLMDEVLGMDVDSATRYAKQLLSMSDKQWGEYNQLWDEKQRRATEIAEQFFKDEMAAIENEYNGKLGDAFDTLEQTAFAGGKDTAQGLIDGLAAMEPEVYAKAMGISERLSSIFSGYIPSNAELAASFSPERIQERYSGVTARDLQSTVAAGVNGISTAMAGQGSGDLTIQIPINGRVFYEATIEDFRAVDQANPGVKDDR